MKLDITFLGRGWGDQKFVLRRLQAVGRTSAVRISSGPMVMQPAADLEVGGSNPGGLGLHRQPFFFDPMYLYSK